MGIQTEYMSFKNRWTISSSYAFHVHHQHSQRWCFSWTALLWFEVLPDWSPALPGAPRLVIGVPSYSAGRQKCPPWVWYSPEISASKFTLHILTDTPGGFQWLKFILLMSPSLLNAPPSLQVCSGAHEYALAESESTLSTSRVGWADLEVLRSTGKGYRGCLGGMRMAFKLNNILLM